MRLADLDLGGDDHDLEMFRDARIGENLSPGASVVALAGVPPSAGTRWMPVPPSNKMPPAALHVTVPSGAAPMSAIVRGSPPTIATRLSSLPERKPTSRLSGDQNGIVAPSVPGSGRASNAPRERMYSSVWSAGPAVYAR